jgi:hypothetical protein
MGICVMLMTDQQSSADGVLPYAFYSPELVEHLLATSRVAIAIASDTLLNVIVIDAGI